MSATHRCTLPRRKSSSSSMRWSAICCTPMRPAPTCCCCCWGRQLAGAGGSGLSVREARQIGQVSLLAIHLHTTRSTLSEGHTGSETEAALRMACQRIDAVMLIM